MQIPSDNGEIRKIFLEIDNAMLPSADLEELVKYKFPIKPRSSDGNEMNWWLFRGKVLNCVGSEELTEKELKLEIMTFVLKNEKRYKQIEKQIDSVFNSGTIDLAKRERIPEQVRLFVWQRDNGRCVKCGSKDKLEFDHIIPVSLGGSSTERNIQLLCESCNRQKGTAI